ncbi:MAG: hypothetical protein QXI16_03175 [Sulfolobaceae archaeon]
MFNLIYDMWANILEINTIAAEFQPSNWVYLLTILTMFILLSMIYYFTFGGLFSILKRLFR